MACVPVCRLDKLSLYCHTYPWPAFRLPRSLPIRAALISSESDPLHKKAYEQKYGQIGVHYLQRWATILFPWSYCYSCFIIHIRNANKDNNSIGTDLPFLFADPKLMECPHAGKDTSAQPPPKSTLGGIPRRVNLHLYYLQNPAIGYTHQSFGITVSGSVLTWAKFLISSLLRRSANPANRLPPPHNTTFESNIVRRSVSH